MSSLTETELRRLLWDKQRIVEKLREMPQTYRTLLGDYYGTNTLLTLLSRKMVDLCRSGEVMQMNIPQHGKEKVFYHAERTYSIVCVSERYGVVTYCFHTLVARKSLFIDVADCHRILGNGWKPVRSRDIDDIYDDNVREHNNNGVIRFGNQEVLVYI